MSSLYPTRIDIPEDARGQMVERLNTQLAATIDLHLQTKQAHWNVKGPSFYALHTFFDDLAESIEAFIDELGERVTALGGIARGTVRMAAATSPLREYGTDIVGGDESLEALIERYATYAALTREAIERAADIGDAASEDLFTEIARTVDKDLYFLESHVQG